MKVLFLDLKAQYDGIKSDINTAIQEVIDSCAFAGGPFVEKFEQEFCTYCDSNYAIGVGSGTEALWLTLLSLEIGKGDEVITVPNTFIATVEAIRFTGAKPVFVDVDERTFTMDPRLLESVISPQTKAIIPVHLFGQIADMDPIMEIARKHEIFVIEDACQSHGAEYKGKKAGSLGDAGCFSFYPGKNLGAYGEAGAVTTNNEDIYKKIKMMRDHGQYKKYHHAVLGWNSRMDGIQGAVLSVKLKHLDKWNEKRRENAKLYNNLLANNFSVTIPVERDNNKHVYHVYAIRSGKRDELIPFLKEHGVHCGIHYPKSVHLQRAFQDLGYEQGSFPVSEQCASELTSLPMYAELSNEKIEYIASKLDHFYNG